LEQTRLLAALFDLARDIAVVAAAAGIAWWCWDQYRTSTERGDQTARLGLTAERQSADMKLWAEKLDARTTAISAHLEQLAKLAHAAQAAQTAQLAQAALLAEARAASAGDLKMRRLEATRADDARSAAKVRVHRLLHSTTDPFLSFVEIERALGSDRHSPDEDAAGETEDTGEIAVLVGDRLRSVLIELVCDGVVAQLDRDRYFIASDYETGDGESERDGDDAA
jgi:hypothetical protein